MSPWTHPKSRVSTVAAPMLWLAAIIAIDGPSLPTAFGQQWLKMESQTQKWLFGVWGTAPNDVFAVGEAGTILHYDGAIGWQVQQAPTVDGLMGIWGTGPKDVFAVGDNGTILHFDGLSWKSMSSGTSAQLLGVWGTGPKEVFAAGQDLASGNGVVLSYDGTWSTVHTEPRVFSDVAGQVKLLVPGLSSGFEIFVTTAGGNVLSWDGPPLAWIQENASTQNHLSSIWVGNDGGFFVAGNGGTIARRNSYGDWTAIDSGTGQYLSALWASEPNDVYAVGNIGTVIHYNGKACLSMDSGTSNDLSGVWGSGWEHVFAVGAKGTILYYKRPLPPWVVVPVIPININAKSGCCASGPIEGLALPGVLLVWYVTSGALRRRADDPASRVDPQEVRRRGTHGSSSVERRS